MSFAAGTGEVVAFRGADMANMLSCQAGGMYNCCALVEFLRSDVSDCVKFRSVIGPQ